MKYFAIYVRDNRHAQAQISRLKETTYTKPWLCRHIYHDRDGLILDECLDAAFRSQFQVLLVPSLTHLRHSPPSFVDLTNRLEQVGVYVMALKPSFGFTPVHGNITNHPAVKHLREACRVKPWEWQ